jgi:glutathione S-transferase
MKLHFSPGACSPAPHTVAREAGLTFDLIKVDLALCHTLSTYMARAAAQPKERETLVVEGAVMTESEGATP